MELAEDLVPVILLPEGDDEAAAHPASAIHEAPSSENKAVGAVPVIVPGSGPTPFVLIFVGKRRERTAPMPPPLVEASFAS